MTSKVISPLTLSLSKGKIQNDAMVRQVPISYGMATESLTHHERFLNNLRNKVSK